MPLDVRHLAFFSKGQPWVSDVYASPLSKEARIAVALPVLRAGKPEHILGLTVPTSRIRDALLPAVPEGWVVGIGDDRGIYVTRSARHDEYYRQAGIARVPRQGHGPCRHLHVGELRGHQAAGRLLPLRPFRLVVWRKRPLRRGRGPVAALARGARGSRIGSPPAFDPACLSLRPIVHERHHGVGAARRSARQGRSCRADALAAHRVRLRLRCARVRRQVDRGEGPRARTC